MQLLNLVVDSAQVLPHPAAQSDAGQEPVTTAGLAPPTATAAIEKPKTDPASKPQATEVGIQLSP